MVLKIKTFRQGNENKITYFTNLDNKVCNFTDSYKRQKCSSKLKKQPNKIHSLTLETKDSSDSNISSPIYNDGAKQKYSSKGIKRSLKQTFIPRNPSEIKKRLKGIQKIMEPFTDELSRVSKDLKEQNIEWNIVNTTLTIIDGYEEQYFQKLAHPNIRTIFVKVKRDEIFKYMFHDTFYYTSNNCSQMEGDQMDRLSNRGEFRYGTKCVSLKNSIIPVPFHHNAFRLGLPEKYQFEKDGQITLTFIHVIRNAIVTHVGDAILENLKIVHQGCAQKLRQRKPFNAPLDGEEEVFSIAQEFGEGYHHAIAEDLTRLSPWPEFLRKNKHIRIHTKSNETYFHELMFTLGLDPSRIVTGNITAKILYLPASTPCGRVVPFNSQLLSLEFRHSIKTPPEPRKSIVVIKRSKKRFFKNHDKIFEMIQNSTKGTDIKVELFSDTTLPDLKDTMAMFNRAFMVIGPHGAGETNLFFSEEGTVDIEGQCYHETKRIGIVLCYRNLMRALGHMYYGHFPGIEGNCRITTPEELQNAVTHYIKHIYIIDSEKQVE